MSAEATATVAHCDKNYSLSQLLRILLCCVLRVGQWLVVVQQQLVAAAAAMLATWMKGDRGMAGLPLHPCSRK